MTHMHHDRQSEPRYLNARGPEEDTHVCVCETQTCWLLCWLVNSLDVDLQLERRHVVTETMGTHGALTWQRHVGHVLLHVTHQPGSREMLHECFVTPVVRQRASRSVSRGGRLSSVCKRGGDVRQTC